MKTTNMPGFTAEASLYRINGQFRTVASDTSYVFDAEIRPQLYCVEQDGHVICSDDGGVGLGYTDVPSGGFPPFPFDHTYAQCRAGCYHIKPGAARQACLAEC